MSARRTVTRNVFWNWIGFAVGILTGFLVAPFLVHRLGESVYGLWVLILAVMSGLTLFDLGLRGSIGRHLAYYRARGDDKALATIARTSRLVLLLAAGGALLALAAIEVLFLRLFDVPADQVGQVRLALALSGASVALTLAMGIYDALLWAHERFDAINAIEVIVAIGQAGTSILLVSRGHSVVALSAVMLVATLVREVGKAILCVRLRAAAGESQPPTWGAAKQLFAFASWNALWSLGQRGTTQSIPMIVGTRLSLANVTSYHVGATLTNYARGMLNTASNVLTPVATALHAAERDSDQQRLFIEGSKYAWGLSLLLVAGLVLLGQTFITLWMGPSLANSSRLLSILAAGELMPMTAGVACGVIMGVNRHRILAGACLLEAVAVIVLGVLLAVPYGLIGICIAVATWATICRGIIPTLYACRMLRLSLHRYATQVLLPPLYVAALPIAALGALVWYRPATGWYEFLVYAGSFTAVFLAMGVLVLRRDWARDPFAAPVLEVDSA